MNQMTRQEILDAILTLNDPQNTRQRLQWFINLGYQMTISARGGYPKVENNIEHLVAFNELQHKLYNQMLHCQTNDEWYKVEELLENLRKYAEEAGVAGDFGWGCTNFDPITDTPVARDQTGEKSYLHSESPSSVPDLSTEASGHPNHALSFKHTEFSTRRREQIVLSLPSFSKRLSPEDLGNCFNVMKSDVVLSFFVERALVVF